MRKMLDYKPLSIDAMTRLSAAALPQGRAWDSKNAPSSNLYKLIKGLTADLRILEDRIYRLTTQWDIRITDDLILEWEKAVGIPDECRKQAEDIETRRLDVITKLKKVPVKTIADYKLLAEVITGRPAAEWNIRPGITEYPTYPEYRFVILVTPPLIVWGAFNYPFGSGILDVSALTSSGTVATATVSDTSTMADGSVAVVSGADQTEYNGEHTITILSSTQFTYNFLGSATSPATGSIKVNFGLTQTQIDALKTNGQYLLKPAISFEGYPFSGYFRESVLRCVFRKITPANVAIVWVY